eukprot:COSAG04_NODE_2145_length_4698_cov_2.402479_2_plen_49_part_00
METQPPPTMDQITMGQMEQHSFSAQAPQHSFCTQSRSNWMSLDEERAK